MKSEKTPHNHQSPLSSSAGQRLLIAIILIIALWGTVFWALQPIQL